MKPIITLALSAATILAAACGLNEKEKISLLQGQQAKDDSIRVAEVNPVKKSQALKSALQDSLAFYNALLERQQNMLIQSRAALYTANDEMTQIKAFHLGRLPQTRDTQVRDQEVKLQTIALEQSKLRTAIQHNTDGISRLKSELGSLKEQ
ncbi:MAG TPA: hypothetical protein VG052_00655 [Puia sp.]|jgi:hypothetical protein|nr:hypothetical protein [Puia sp.]